MEELFLMYTKDDMVEALIYLGKCGEAAAKALVNFGESLKKLKPTAKLWLSEAYKSAPNNWRKIHGLPMRRRGGRRWR